MQDNRSLSSLCPQVALGRRDLWAHNPLAGGRRERVTAIDAGLWTLLRDHARLGGPRTSGSRPAGSATTFETLLAARLDRLALQEVLSDAIGLDRSGARQATRNQARRGHR